MTHPIVRHIPLYIFLNSPPPGSHFVTVSGDVKPHLPAGAPPIRWDPSQPAARTGSPPPVHRLWGWPHRWRCPRGWPPHCWSKATCSTLPLLATSCWVLFTIISTSMAVPLAVINSPFWRTLTSPLSKLRSRQKWCHEGNAIGTMAAKT